MSVQKSSRLIMRDEIKQIHEMIEKSLQKGFDNYLKKFEICELCSCKWNPHTMEIENVKEVTTGLLVQKMLCRKCSTQLEAVGQINWICCNSTFFVKTDYNQHRDAHHSRGR